MALGANASPHLVEEPAILLIKILDFMLGQDQFSYKTQENMYILLQTSTQSNFQLELGP